MTVPLLWGDRERRRRDEADRRTDVGELVSSAFLTLEMIPISYTYRRYSHLKRSQRTKRPLAEVCGIDLPP